VALGAAACSSGGSTVTPSTPLPTPTTSANLQGLAAAGLHQSYTAIYTVSAPNKAGTKVVMRRTPAAYRLDVQRGVRVSILIHNVHGTYSCQQIVGHHRANCLFVARRQNAVPALFDAGQKLWADYLVELSRDAGAYTVKPAGTKAATAHVPAATCYSVTAGATKPRTPVAPGTYCLTSDGVPVSAKFTSGTFQLTALTKTAPAARFLVPVSKPTPIPRLH
jgi:hypothetical protein